MKACCRRLCCILFCCRCSKTNPLKSLDEDTRLLPKSERTRAILEKNEIYSFGVIPENLRGAVIDISAYTRSFVRKIVCGNNHCLILFNDGQLAAFGSNEEGQLGFEFKKDGNYYNEITMNKFSVVDTLAKRSGFGLNIQTPPVISDYEIWDIAAGDNYSLVLIRSGMRTLLVRFGINSQDKYSNDFSKVKSVNLVEGDYDKIGSISKVFVFGKRSILLTLNNDIYVGGIDFEQNTLDLDKFKHLERFSKQIKCVDMGLEHCLVLDFEGGLYSLGDNTYGELGLDNLPTAEKFTRVNYPFESPIKKVSTGARHSLVLLENGTLFAFGDNSEGQCAGSQTRYATPVHVVIDSRDKIVDIYSGYNHNLMVLASGEMLTWGDTSSGKLGYFEGNMTQATPRVIQSMKGKFPNQIGLGFGMSVISTSMYENSLVALNK